MKDILLLSSGIDSVVAWFYLGKPDCLHISGHSRYSEKEWNSLVDLSLKLKEMNLRIVSGQNFLRQFEKENAEIPGRNGLFCWIAASYGDIIHLPCQLGEQSIPDRNPQNLDSLSSVLSIFYGSPKKIDIVFPDMTKQDIVKWALKNGVSKEILLSTYSCFNIGIGRCGECEACARTAIALEYSSILPEDFFVKNIWEWEGWNRYVPKLLAGEYEERRTKQWLSVLERKLSK